jgi:tRNA pseudouridine13 synthase
VSVPEIERQIGIETYVTKTEGVDGSVRRQVSDFVVEEILVDGSKASVEGAVSKPPLGASEVPQRFLLCALVKRNWDTLIAVKNVAKQLNIEQSQVQIAGIKDAKAVTAQHVTVEGVTAEEAAKFRYRDIELRSLGYFREALSSFYLLGNSFRIIIRNIALPAQTIAERVQKTTSDLQAIGGIPNFYGHQRFGTTRAITHLVGKALVQGKLDEAAMLFLAKPSVHEHPESMRVRAELWASRDFRQALRDFPVQLRFERLMLAHLAENLADFAGAFGRLPLKLQLMFVQAYQSFLFNRFLSQRILRGFPLNRAVAGDFVVNVDRSGLPMVQTSKAVDETRLAEVNGQIAAGKMRVALPVVGFAQRLSQGEVGEHQHQILDEEGVDLRGFRVAVLPRVGARGEVRAAFAPVKDFSFAVSADDMILGLSKIELRFTLLRSSYATVLLREVMKPKDLIAAGF